MLTYQNYIFLEHFGFVVTEVTTQNYAFGDPKILFWKRSTRVELVGAEKMYFQCIFWFDTQPKYGI